jgi:hypothetical protein
MVTVCFSSYWYFIASCSGGSGAGLPSSSIYILSNIEFMKSSFRYKLPSSWIAAIASYKASIALVTLLKKEVCVAGKPSHWHTNFEMQDGHCATQSYHFHQREHYKQILLKNIIFASTQTLIEERNIVSSIPIHSCCSFGC